MPPFRHFTSLLTSCLFALVAAGDETAAGKVTPTKVNLKQADSNLADVAAAMTKIAGLSITVEPELAKRKHPVAFAGTPLWEALDQIARDADAKLVIADSGKSVTIVRRGAARVVSGASGAFRVSVRAVNGRFLLESGTSFFEILLDVHWEPRYPVFRIDGNPKIVAAKFDKSNDLITDPTITRHHPSGALTDMRVRLTGLPRRAAKIDVLAGEFRATAAEKMLTFKFDDLTVSAAAAKTVDRVAAKLKPLTFDETTKTWDVELELVYPPGGPAFESFEEHKWLRDNRLQLVSPQGMAINPDSEDVIASGSKVAATYRFKTQNPKAKGWSLVYEVPGPLVEVTVPFKLENIPLP